MSDPSPASAALRPGPMVGRWLLSCLVALTPAGAAQSPTPATPASRPKVALTFDDLPVHGSLPPGRSRIDVVRDILEALRAAGAPAVYGFINAKDLSEPGNEEVLRLWRAAGFPLGNHTFSHLDLHAATPDAFESDVLANEPALRRFMGEHGWRWFRYPYLHAGETADKQRAVASMLRRHGYRVAEVTLSFDDWAYHDPYARCVARGDQRATAWLRDSYLARAAESIDAGQTMARLLHGRDVNHVMLLHVGGFNAVMLPSLLALLRERGFQLVTLEEAHDDPAYALQADVALASGGTLLEPTRVARQTPRPAGSESPSARLADLCR